MSMDAGKEKEDQMSSGANSTAGENAPSTEHDAEKATPPAKPAGGPPPGPNGGSQAWMQVLGGFMLFFNTFGILKFGVFQTFYESGQLFKASSSDISWIGSLQSFLLLLFGFLSGPLFDRGYLRALLIFGTFMVAFGFMMLSLCTEFYQALLAQGFVVGIGAGSLFVPAVAILPTYFTTKIATAIGIAASGSSFGGIIYPIVFYRLIPEVGFPWAVRVLGFMALATLVVPIFVMKQRIRPPKARSLIDFASFKDTHYMIFIGGSLLGFAGVYVGLFYYSFFGQATGYTGEALSFYLIPILNAASILGRTLPNIVADKLGPFNVIAPSSVILSIVLFCNLAVTSEAGVIVSTIFFGFFSGVFIALPPVVFHTVTPDKTKMGTRIGMGNAIIGLGILIGGPGGGGILQRNPPKLDWVGTWSFAGAMTMACAAVFVALRVMRGGFRVEKC